MADAKKIDPFDVEALEKSLNDSATRVSTIWVSYLIFGLYLIIAVANVTHRQLFLEDPIKLPVLNIDLPLVGFFFLAPILFAFLHTYVLIQVLLLARTAAIYNEAADKNFEDGADNSRVRHRLANTLFAQIFSGADRDRKGVLGAMLTAIAWVTLAIAPLLLLLTFEAKFLPFHSTLMTWSHRLGVLFDFVAVLGFWLKALAAKSPSKWQAALGKRLYLGLGLGSVFFSMILSFPGEVHIRWMRFFPNAVQTDPDLPSECQNIKLLNWILPPNFDRFWLQFENAIDPDKLMKIESSSRARELEPHEGERTRNFRSRDLACGNFYGADLRRADFSNAFMLGTVFREADLRGASLTGLRLQMVDLYDANLDGASFQNSDLRRVNFHEARLRGSNFTQARLEEANLQRASLQGARFSAAHMQGADLTSADLRGAILAGAKLHGANLSYAQMQGSILFAAELPGASLLNAQLQGSILLQAQIQGADLTNARLDGAVLDGAQLQGTVLKETRLILARITYAFVWRAYGAACNDAQVLAPQLQPVLQNVSAFAPSEQKSVNILEAIENFINKVVDETPADHKERMGKVLRSRLVNDKNSIGDETDADRWRLCAQKRIPNVDYARRHAAYLVDLACKPGDNQKYVADGIRSFWIDSSWIERNRQSYPDFYAAKTIARGLLGLDGKPCFNVDRWDAGTRTKLRDLAETQRD